MNRLALYLWVAFLLNYVDRQMVYSIFPALQKDVGFTSVTLGLIGSVFMWVYTLAMPLAGWLADRGWAGKLIAGSLALWSAATWGCATAGGIGLAYCVWLWGRLKDQGAEVEQAAPVRGSAWGAVRVLAGNGRFLALAGVFSLYNAVQWVLLAWFPTYLQDRLGLSMTASGFNATVYVQVCVLVGILGGSVVTDRWRRGTPGARLYVTAAGLLLSAPFTWLAFQATSLNEARVYSALFGLFGGLLAGNVFAAAYDITPAETRGLSGSLLNMSGGVAAAVMIYMAGVWRETLGIAVLLGWLTVGAVGMAGVLLVVAAMSRRSKSVHSSL